MTLKVVVFLGYFLVSLVSANLFSITDQIYNTLWRGDSGSAIARYMTGDSGDTFLYGGPPMYDDLRFTQTCIRRCMHNPDCASSQLRWGSRGIICHLLPQNLCVNPNTPFSPGVPGFTAGDLRSYDKIPDSQSPRSCQQNCYLQNPGNCISCNRPGCIGPDCKNCSQSCAACNSNFFPNATSEDNRCILWTGNPPAYPVAPVGCKANRMLLYRQFHFPNGTNIDTITSDKTFSFAPCFNFVNTTGHNLYIELYPEDPNLPMYDATYSGFYCYAQRNLTIGAFAGGTAGDGFGAPLNLVPFDSVSYSPSCGPFWHINSSNDTTSTPATTSVASMTNSVTDTTSVMGISTTVAPVPNTPFGQGPCPGGLTAWFGTPATVNGVFNSGIAWASLPGVKLVGVKVYMY